MQALKLFAVIVSFVGLTYVGAANVAYPLPGFPLPQSSFVIPEPLELPKLSAVVGITENIGKVFSVVPPACALPIDPAAIKRFNKDIHTAPGTGHGWYLCGSPECAVDLNVGKTPQEAYQAALAGVPIYATFDATVTAVTALSPGSCVTINANQGDNVMVYCHVDPSVSVGQSVTVGQQIGKLHAYIGEFGPHLHAELKFDGAWVFGDGFQGTWDNQRTTLTQCASTVPIQAQPGTPIATPERKQATHRECIGKSCVVIPGPGLDQCSINADCKTRHTTCLGNSCIIVLEPGTDECNLLDDEPCPIKSYTDCRTIDGAAQCVNVIGRGPNRCFNDDDCKPTALPAPPEPGIGPPVPIPPGPAPSCPGGTTPAQLASRLLTQHYRGNIEGTIYNGDGKYTCIDQANCVDLHYTAQGRSLAGYGNCQVSAISREVLLVMLALIENEGFSIGTYALCSDHSTYTTSGNISRHVLGKAVDIASVNGVNLNNYSALSGTLAVDQYINTLIGSCLGVDELISCGVGGREVSQLDTLSINNGVSSPGFSCDVVGNHTDHIHIGY